MKIYVSHKRSEAQFGLYNALKPLDHQFIFPHKSDQGPYDGKSLFQSKGCDLVLAEVSEPATGQGIELGWADIFKIPIICVYKNGSKISNSLKLISKTFIEYSDYDDLRTKLIQTKELND